MSINHPICIPTCSLQYRPPHSLRSPHPPHKPRPSSLFNLPNYAKRPSVKATTTPVPNSPNHQPQPGTQHPPRLSTPSTASSHRTSSYRRQTLARDIFLPTCRDAAAHTGDSRLFSPAKFKVPGALSPAAFPFYAFAREARTCPAAAV